MTFLLALMLALDDVKNCVVAFHIVVNCCDFSVIGLIFRPSFLFLYREAEFAEFLPERIVSAMAIGHQAR